CHRVSRAAGGGAVSGDTSADAMDRVLDADRRDGSGTKRTYRETLGALPAGADVEIDCAAWLVWDGTLHAWTAAGYTERRQTTSGPVTVITPRCIVAVLRGG